MVKTLMNELVSDLEDNVRKLFLLDPFCNINDAPADSLFIFGNLVLTLIMAAKNDGRSAPVTSLNNMPYALKVDSRGEPSALKVG
jgi:hypothetical protein